MSDDEEDWFESALQDEDDQQASETADESRDETVEEPTPTADAGDASADPAFEEVPDGLDDAPPTGGTDDEELFQDDFAAAFENAAGPGSDSGGGGFGAGGGPGAGGDPGGGFDPGAFGGEPFASEFDDDADFDSDIPRIDVGIEGLDSMILGGVPERSLMVAIGDAGTGKTTFGLQFLEEGLANGENAVFITLEESRERVFNTAAEKGWDFEGYADDGQLAVLDLDPLEMANTLQSIRGELPDLIREFDASRLVLDSVSLLEMMYDDRATRRNEIFDFAKSLKRAGVTTMLTSEASEDNPYVSRYGIIEYLTDAVFILRYIRSTDDFRETRLAVEIQKIRDANHSREIKPYEITDSGISVYGQANIF